MEIKKNCAICQAELHKKHILREMMFGLKDTFTYYECGYCGCIQISEFPHDIEKYYPYHYYSFNDATPQLKKQPWIKRIFKNYRINKKYKLNQLDLIRFLEPIRLKASSKILDIGCGRGTLISQLFNIGFENVSGIDKFIPEEINYKYGVKIMKKALKEMEQESFDLLMMHHVLEHMEDQVETFYECRRILKNKAYLIVRIPIAKEAWKKYGKDWVQLDPPRHYFIHTINSINILAKKTNLKLTKVIFDSTDFQFWGSEMYRNNIPLFDQNIQKYRTAADYFTPETLLNFQKQAHVLNKNEQGDQAIFYLQKA